MNLNLKVTDGFVCHCLSGGDKHALSVENVLTKSPSKYFWVERVGTKFKLLAVELLPENPVETPVEIAIPEELKVSVEPERPKRGRTNR